MATTTNYAWETPDDTDLVKDGAAAIRTLGSSIDTTTKALNPSTTLGDIEYRSSTANTNTRLGIGTTGQVLTVAAGVPSWATPSSASTAKGVSVYDSVGNQTIANNTWTAATWNSENFDTDAFHSTSSNTTRLTIPAGLGGKYSIKCQMMWGLSATGTRYIRLYKNGSVIKESGEVIPSATLYVAANFSTDLELVAGDYLELYAYQNSGSSQPIYTTILDSQFSLMYWGA